MINPFSKKIKNALDKARKDEHDKCEREFIREKRLALDELSNEKDLQIAELEAELQSVQMKAKFHQDQCDKMLKERYQVKLDKKRTEKLGNDLYFLVKEYVADEAKIVQQIGIILRDSGIKLIEE